MEIPDFHGLNKAELEEMAAMLQSEAGVLERSAYSLDEVVIENEANGYESWIEDMAADVCRRLAAYLRRDADEALGIAGPQDDYVPWGWTPDNYAPWGWTPEIEF